MTARDNPADAEAACLAGIDAVGAYCAGGPPAAESVEGVILYATMLEATLIVTSGGADIPAIRAAARETAAMWRRRANGASNGAS